MPITFEAPGPIGAIESAARQGGGGGSISEMYAAEMAAKQQSAMMNAQLMARDREGRDAQSVQQAQFAASRQFSPRDEGMAVAAMAQQQQRVELQMQANQQEMSAAENMRLQRLKQGEDGVRQQLAEGVITNDEAGQMMTQLRTGINPLEMRRAQTQIHHQEMQNKAIQNQMKIAEEAEQRRARAEDQAAQYQTASIQGKIKQVPDEHVVRSIMAQIQADVPELSPDQARAMAEQEAVQNGHYTVWYPDKNGRPTMVDKANPLHPAAKGGSGGPGGEGGEPSAKSGKGGGTPAFDPSRAYHDAETAVDKMVTDGKIKPEDAQAEIQKRFDARKAAHAGYTSEQSGQRNAGKPAPFNPADPNSGTDLQKGQIVKILDLKTKVGQNPALTDNFAAQREAQADIDRLAALTAKWSSPQGGIAPEAPSWIKNHARALSAKINKALTPPPGSDGTKGFGQMSYEEKLNELERRAREREKAGTPTPEAPKPPERPAIMKGALGDVNEWSDRQVKPGSQTREAIKKANDWTDKQFDAWELMKKSSPLGIAEMYGK